jgi:hypothetical protein
MNEQVTDRSPYKDDTGEAQLLHSVAAFFDILGYRQRIKDAFERGRGKEELAKLRSALAEARVLLDQIVNDKMFDKRLVDVRSFSDNVLLAIPIIGHPISPLYDVVHHLSWFQMEMSRRGYFIRGAVAIGEIYTDADVIFGPALLEAVDGEKDAKNPCVIFCPSAETALQDESTGWGGYEPPHRFHGFVREIGGRPFIDYLEESVMGDEDEGGPYTKVLTQHKHMIEQSYAELPLDSTNRCKYEWLAAYHNYFCDRHPHSFEASAKVMLPSEGPNFEPLRNMFDFKTAN